MTLTPIVLISLYRSVWFSFLRTRFIPRSSQLPLRAFLFMDSDIKNSSRQQKNKKSSLYVFDPFRKPEAQAAVQKNCQSYFCNAIYVVLTCRQSLVAVATTSGFDKPSFNKKISLHYFIHFC